MAITIKIIDHLDYAIAVEDKLKFITVEVISFPDINRFDLAELDNPDDYYELDMEFGSCDMCVECARDLFEMDRDTTDIIDTAVAFDDDGYMSIDEDLRDFLMDLMDGSRDDHPWMDEHASITFLNKNMPTEKMAVH